MTTQTRIATEFGTYTFSLGKTWGLHNEGAVYVEYDQGRGPMKVQISEGGVFNGEIVSASEETLVERAEQWIAERRAFLSSPEITKRKAEYEEWCKRAGIKP